MPQLIVSSASGTGVIPVSIVKLHTRAGIAAMASWHRNIQRPFMDAVAPTPMPRADVGWNWPRYFWGISSVIWANGHTNFSFALVARNARGNSVTVALALGMEPFSCVELSDGRRPTDGFVWYITGIPADAAAHYGVAGVKVTAQAVALCKKICQAVKPDAEIVLHADPRGPALLQFYEKKCMMNPIPVDAVIRAPRKRINDGRFFLLGNNLMAATPQRSDERLDTIANTLMLARAAMAGDTQSAVLVDLSDDDTAFFEASLASGEYLDFLDRNPQFSALDASDAPDLTWDEYAAAGQSVDDFVNSFRRSEDASEGDSTAVPASHGSDETAGTTETPAKPLGAVRDARTIAMVVNRNAKFIKGAFVEMELSPTVGLPASMLLLSQQNKTGLNGLTPRIEHVSL